MPKNWELIVGLGAVVAGAWSYLKSVAGWLRGLVVCSARTNRDIAGFLHAYLARAREATAREPCYDSNEGYFVRPLGRKARVMWQDRVESGAQLMWSPKKRPIWFRKEKRKDEGDDYSYVFAWFRGTVDWEALLVEADAWSKHGGSAWEHVRDRRHVVYHFGKRLGAELKDQKKHERDTPDVWFAGFGETNSRRLLGWKNSDVGAPASRAIDGLALTPELLEVVAHVRRWHQSREWYATRHLPWRLGLLFWGAPGTGKTSLARELANDLNMPVHVLDLASMSNEDLREAWAEAAADGPCVVLLEDVDGVFDGRVNVAPSGGIMSSGGLTFDCLLNCVDGVERADGVLLVLTTNDPAKVDPALVRPGRVDRSVEFRALDFPCRLKVAKAILGDTPDATALAFDNDGVTAAKFTEVCCRAALEAHYRSSGGEPYR